MHPSASSTRTDAPEPGGAHAALQIGQSRCSAARAARTGQEPSRNITVSCLNRRIRHEATDTACIIRGCGSAGSIAGVCAKPAEFRAECAYPRRHVRQTAERNFRAPERRPRLRVPFPQLEVALAPASSPAPALPLLTAASFAREGRSSERPFAFRETTSGLRALMWCPLRRKLTSTSVFWLIGVERAPRGHQGRTRREAALLFFCGAIAPLINRNRLPANAV